MCRASARRGSVFKICSAIRCASCGRFAFKASLACCKASPGSVLWPSSIGCIGTATLLQIACLACGEVTKCRVIDKERLAAGRVFNEYWRTKGSGLYGGALQSKVEMFARCTPTDYEVPGWLGSGARWRRWFRRQLRRQRLLYILAAPCSLLCLLAPSASCTSRADL